MPVIFSKIDLKYHVIFSKIDLICHFDFQLTIQLREGIGISLVNHAWEDLVYMSLRQIDIYYHTSSTDQILEASIGDLQVYTVNSVFSILFEFCTNFCMN